MEYEDRLRIATPEGVDLELTLAGVGSRFSAAIIDFLIQIALLAALAVAFLLTGDFGGWGGAAFAILAFLLFAGYDVLFEVLASGRTPGKRLNGIRVVRVDGTPVRFLTSTVRNVLRLIDMLFFYLVGIVSILVTRRNQRIGDLAAGTLVVRERMAATPKSEYAGPPATPRPAGEWQSWDVGGVTAEELSAVRAFLARRYELTPEARRLLGDELAEGFRRKVPGLADDVPAESLLLGLVAAKEQRGRA
jgi:uncharacterized RDD family membrane protein YckC